MTLAALALAACSAARDSATVTLELWGLGREGEEVAELTRGFERENPGVRVRVQQIPWTAAHEKLLTGFVGRATPDIAQLGNTWVPELAALGAIEPLNELIAASAAVSRERFFPGIWDTNVLDGAVYGIPWYVDTRVLFYRSDLLAEAGYDNPPVTWAEWLDAMRRIKARHPDRYAILLPTDEWGPPIVLGLQAGATFLRDGDRFGAFSDPAFARAFDFYTGLFREKLAPQFSTAEIGNLYQQFAEGYFVFYIAGPWYLEEFRRRMPPDVLPHWAAAPMPAPTAAEYPGLSLAGGSSLVLFSASRHKAEAWRLIEYLSAPERQKRFWELTGDLPATVPAWHDPALADPRTQAFFRQLARVRPMPQVPEWEQIVTKLFQVAQEAIHGRRSSEDTLALLDREVDRILTKRRWVLERKETRAAQ